MIRRIQPRFRIFVADDHTPSGYRGEADNPCVIERYSNHPRYDLVRIPTRFRSGDINALFFPSDFFSDVQPRRHTLRTR